MSRVQKFSLFVILSLLLSFSITTAHAATYYYATTDMTFAEFYAGETKESSSDLYAQGLDAISTPTTHGLARFPLVLGVSGDTGTTISGLKAVQVRMPEDVYAALSSDSRFTFTDSEFDEYKPVNSDGTFGAMLTETTTPSNAVAIMATGSSARWGHYVISVQSADITIGSANKYCDYYLGALIQTAGGKIYGLRHDNNIWSNTDIAFCVSANYTEPHGTGVTRDYDYTVNLEGETITKITYMLKGRPDVVINTNLYVKKQTSATVQAVSPELDTGETVQVQLALTNANGYTFSGVALRSGRASIPVTNCTYSDGVLTLTNPAAGSYTATFTSDEYVDISATFTLSDHFATTNMTWAEFYAGEVASTSAELFAAGMDAISSPTARVANNFTQLVSVSNDIGGRDITGVRDVQVKMTGDVYKLLSNDSRYTFTDETFTEYKVVNADGSFGAMVTQTVTASSADVTLSSGASAVWGNYVLNIKSADVTLGSGDTRYYLGALITTNDGKVYGMRHNNNLWSNANDMALSVQEFVEVHGVSRKYAYTSDMAGKTITKIQYMLKNLPDVIVNCNITLPAISTAEVALSVPEITSGTNISIPFKFTGLPSGVTYELVSLYTGSRRNRTYITDYTYANNTITINGEAAPGNYTAIFRAKGYTDIGLTFYVGKYHYATTNMTWAEFYAGEIGTSSADLWDAGLDAVSSPTARVAGRFTQLASESNDLGGRDITGVKAVQVRMVDDVYQRFSDDVRYTFVDTEFAEYKEVNADGTFGEMFTEYEESDNAIVTLKSGANSTWGNYMLSIASADIALTSGDDRLDLGALITTNDGQVYGLRHNSNLWFSAGEIALTYKEFIEPHGIIRDYDYTSDLQGKTITRIQFMLKNKPDVVIDCSVFLKLESPASVSYAYPEGYHGILAGTGDPVTITFSNLPSGVTYDIASVTPSIRHAAALDSELYDYSDGELTFSPTLGAGKYKAVFSTERYSDLAATVELFTTNATNLIVSDDNNGAGLFFMLTPVGYIDAVDDELTSNKFVNASDYTTLAENSTTEYTSGRNEISGSGFTFDIVLEGVSDDYTGIVGFGKIVVMDSTTLGSLYDSVYTAVNSIPIGASGWREIPKFSALNSAGLKVVQVLPDGTSRDISDITGTGAAINSDGSITFFYGVMAADSSTITEGEYTLSPEGETLINDGLRDGHISTTIYIEGTQSGSSTPDTPSTPTSPDTPVTPDTPDKGDSYSATPGTPAVNVHDSPTAQKILDALSSGSSAVTSSTQVLSLPANSAGRVRGIASVSAEELAAIPNNETIAVILPLMSVDKAAVYVFGVDLSNLEAEAYIFLHMTAEPETANAAAFHSSAEETAYTFLDDDGNETNTVPANKHVNVAAYMQPDYTYAPVITTSSYTKTSTLGSSGGGCSTIETLAPMMLAVLLLLSRKR